MTEEMREIEDIIRALPKLEQLEIDNASAEIRRILMRYGGDGILALARVGAETLDKGD